MATPADCGTCFVISPIGDEESDTRKRSDQVLKHVIAPAVEECGYTPVRADNISEPGMITSQVIQHIVDDPLVVADLTGRNPNVFYELAIRHAIRKPLVQLIKKGEQIPFDVAGTRTIHLDEHDLDSVDEGRKEIVRQVKALETNASDVETPISVSLDLQLLRQSENPEQRSLADLLSMVTDLHAAIVGLEVRLASPEKILPPAFLAHALSQATSIGNAPRWGKEHEALIEAIDRVKTLSSTEKAPDTQIWLDLHGLLIQALGDAPPF